MNALPKKSDYLVYPYEFEFVVVNKITGEIVKPPEKPSWDGIPVTAKMLKALYVSASLENYGHKHTKEVEEWWDNYVKSCTHPLEEV